MLHYDCCMLPVLLPLKLGSIGTGVTPSFCQFCCSLSKFMKLTLETCGAIHGSGDALSRHLPKVAVTCGCSEGCSTGNVRSAQTDAFSGSHWDTSLCTCVRYSRVL